MRQFASESLFRVSERFVLIGGRAVARATARGLGRQFDDFLVAENADSLSELLDLERFF